MSILLQALKKSESQRELGGVPTLQTQTEVLSGLDQEPPLWLPVLLILSTVLLITWIGLDQYRVSEGLSATDPVQLDARHEDPGKTRPQDELKSLADGKPSTAGADAATAPPQANVLPQLSGAGLSPAETVTEAQQAPAQRRLGREVRNYVADDSPLENETAASEPSRENAVRQTGVATLELDTQKVASVTSQQVDRSPQSPVAADSYQSEPISYWQVPEKMREGLPDLRISVLVFAEQPESRFVLLNGERMREGDELPNGLMLEEIRRDHAIFKYRNYRFFLKG